MQPTVGSVTNTSDILASAQKPTHEQEKTHEDSKKVSTDASVGQASIQSLQTAEALKPVDTSTYRLQIERDAASGTYVYKTYDSVTGKVISQIPDEQMLKLKQDPNYKACSVVSRKI